MNKIQYIKGDHTVTFTYITASFVKVEDMRGKDLMGDRAATRLMLDLQAAGYREYR